MRKLLYILPLAGVLFAAPACQQSYTEKAKSGETGQRDEDMQDTGKSVHDEADGGMGDKEGKTETNN